MQTEPRPRFFDIADLVGISPVEGEYTEEDERKELQLFYDNVGQYHIPVWEGIVGGRVVFLPGSDVRAEMISEHFSQKQTHGAERGIKAYSGTIDDIPVLTIASGMGSGQTEIIALELMRAMVNKGGAIIRYGSMGALKPVPTVRVGDLLIAKWAVTADSSFAWMTDNEIARGARVEISVDVIQCLQNALDAAGFASGAYDAGCSSVTDFVRPESGVVYHTGGIHSKALLYAQEIGLGPRRKHFERMKRVFEQDPGLYGSEMETALLYTIARRMNYLMEKYEGRVPLLVGSLGFFIGDSEHPFHPDPEVRKTAERGLVSTVPYVARKLYDDVRLIQPRS
jgi:uridine phosphorylase